jgi:hypothetical protein
LRQKYSKPILCDSASGWWSQSHFVQIPPMPSPALHFVQNSLPIVRSSLLRAAPLVVCSRIVFHFLNMNFIQPSSLLRRSLTASRTLYSNGHIVVSEFVSALCLFESRLGPRKTLYFYGGWESSKIVCSHPNSVQAKSHEKSTR